jgi:hypothetical protein
METRPSCSALVVYNCLASLIWLYGRNPLTGLNVIQRLLCKTLVERLRETKLVEAKGRQRTDLNRVLALAGSW